MDNPSTPEPDTTPVTKSATDARQGETRGIMRWVLGVSTLGAIVAMVVAYWFVHGV